MKDSQTSRILAQLRIASMTPLDAFRAIGTLRLGARIFELRREGHQIKTDMVTVGKGTTGYKRVARYRLIREAR